MIVYRLSKGKYRNDLSGAGAEMYGGRWNNKGTKMLYTATSRALAMSEVAVHMDFKNIPKDYWMSAIEVPKDVELLVLEGVGKYEDWNSHPPSQSTQRIGDKLVEDHTYLGMFVPSAIVQGDQNLILNPLHQDYGKVRIVETEPFTFDQRLFTP